MIFHMLLGHGGHGAHDGHDLLAGLIHPFSGMDHLLAMLAVGLWASQLGRTGRWALPLSAAGSVVATVAVAHGLGHFARVELGGSAVWFAMGLIVGSAALAAVSAAVGLYLRGRRWTAAPRWCGTAFAILALVIAVMTRL